MCVCVCLCVCVGEGPPSRVLRQRRNTCPTVVVIAGEQLGLLVVSVTHGARDFPLLSSSKFLSLKSGSTAMSS